MNHVNRVAPSWGIGFDMGGTYVDVAAISSAGELIIAKRPYGDSAPVDSVLETLAWLLDAHAISPASVVRLVHGSTIVTNLLLEQKGAPVAVMTNAGFADVLTIGRQSRRDLYAVPVRPQVPQALFPAQLRATVGGRIDAQGREIEPLGEPAVEAALRHWVEHGVQSAAICLLHACRNPVHELRVRELALTCAPTLHISLSHEVDPQPREFERFLAAALDAYAKPSARRYLGTIVDGCLALGLPAPQVMRSNGFLAACEAALERPLALAMSGPAATLEGVGALAGALGSARSIISLDIGGTTTDIGLIENARLLTSSTLSMGPFELRLRSADVLSIAIGGGSVARVNQAGAIRLGPESQGARPGPAAYGQGGSLPTLTDALVVLGRLPEELAGGLRLQRTKAAQAIETLATALGCDLDSAAQAVVATAHAAIAEGVKDHAFNRGIDPSDCVLVAAGGGGAQHVAEIAELVGASKVFIPPHSGVAAALGLLVARSADTVEESINEPLEGFALRRSSARLQALLPGAVAERDADALRCTLDICYDGQESALELSVDPEVDTPAAVAARFDALHARVRGHALAGHAHRVRKVRLEALGCVASPELALPAETNDDGARAADQMVRRGPCRIVEQTTTAWVPRDWHAQAPASGGWTLTRDVLNAQDDPDALEAVDGEPSGASVAGILPPVDIRLLEPLRLSLQGIADRMQHGMMMGAHSSVAREGGDCAAAIFLPDGRLLSQARSLPLLLGSLIPAVEGVLRRFPVRHMRPGDGYLLNDPWQGGSHLPDLTVVHPVFAGDRLVALNAASLHHQDIGGATPGSLPTDARDIFQEGLRVPPLRAWRRNVLEPAVLDILCANSRTPSLLNGDLGAQWAAVCLGAKEIGELAARHGTAAFASGAEALIEEAARMTRLELLRHADGEAVWEDTLDGDGITGEPVRLRVTLRKQADRIALDFTGSQGQTSGPINAAPAAMLSAALFFMRSLAPDAPNNAGCLLPLELTLPPGTIVNPDFPAALNARTATVKLATNAILGAWSRHVDASDMSSSSAGVASNAGVAAVISVGGQGANGKRYFFTEIIASGAGASARADGVAGISTDVSNARNTPVEALEAQAPILMRRYGLNQGSGGSGLRHGGAGIGRAWQLLEGRATVSYRGERHTSHACGLHGGMPGGCSEAWVERADGSRTRLDTRARVELQAGDTFVVQTAGGGGWGPATDAGPAGHPHSNDISMTNRNNRGHVS